uniref:sigma-70 family RNA polymerase sigma factor n=1 Tax=Faecalibacterium prausnitzii TaxID=853 RepID=UPI003FF0B4AE
MEFNNGNERRKLNKKWERLRVQYQQAGMSEDAIQAMYDFDLGVLNSERSYVANTLAIVGDGDDSTGRKSSDFKQYEKAIAVTDTYHETRTRFAWVGKIKDKRLQEGLEKLSDEELRLITLYFRDEYSTVELSKVYGIAQQNISKRILKITKFLKKFGFLGVD